MKRGTRLGVGERRAVVAGFGVLAWLVGLLWIFPVGWTVFASFKTEQDASAQTLHQGLGFVNLAVFEQRVDLAAQLP